MKKSHLVLGCLLGLTAGCATQTVDNTPKRPTSVLTANYTVNGLFVPDYHGKQVVYTREKQRRLDHDTEFDSFMMRWANFNTSDIFRIDENLIWSLDHGDETYRECPLEGCASPFDQLMNLAEDDSQDQEDYESFEDRGCQVEMALNEFAVKSTGRNRQIAGLSANEYTVNWTTEFEDPQGKKDRNVVQFVFWTTAPNADMQEAWALHRKATENYLEAVGEKNVMVRLLGKEGYRTLSAFAGDTEKTDPQQYNAFTRELAKIEGYPLSIKLEWFQKMEACQDQAAQGQASRGGIDLSGGVEGAAMDMVGGFLDQKKDQILAQWDKDARVRYIYEVTSVGIQSVHDSKFEVPATYTLEDRQ